MQSKAPQENFPLIGTVENPAFFFDGDDLYLGYEIAPAAGGGVAILKFSNVIHFERNPINVQGLGASRYPVSPWSFTEVIASDRTAKWLSLNPRFWTISFNDVTLEVIFSKVEKVLETAGTLPPSVALLSYLFSQYGAKVGPH